MKVSIIGYGVWGKKIVKTLKDIRNVEIKYICKKNPIIGSLSEEYNFVYDYKKAINEDVDYVIICTLPKLNFEIAKFALEKKKHIFVEKPVCLNNINYDELFLLAKKKECIMHINYIHLFNSNFKIFKNKFDQLIKGKYRAEIYLGSPMLERKYLNLYYDWFPHIISMISSIENNFSFKIKDFKIKKNKYNKQIYHLNIIINNNEYDINFGNGFSVSTTSYKIFKDNMALEYSDKNVKFNEKIINNENIKLPLEISLNSFFDEKIDSEFEYKYDKTTKIMNDIYNKVF